MRALALSLLSALVLSTTVHAADPADAAVKENPLPAKKPPMGTLSDKELSELLTTWKCPKTGKTMTFRAGVSRVFLSPEKNKSEYRKYQRSGQVPFRVTAELIESKTTRGKVVSKLEGGTANIYVLDSEGKLVLKKSSSLSKMCPT